LPRIICNSSGDVLSVQKISNANIEVSVKVSFVEAESQPDNSLYFFSYKVQVTNRGSAPAQLMSRHWIITDGFGEVEEVRGAGVIGQQPKINPGQSFDYESACPLGTPSGSMKGFYQMVDQNGETFEIEIPEFYLIAPTALH
jgi:ApaG protein